MEHSRRLPVLALLLAVAACHPEFKLTNYPTNEALFRVASEELAAHRYDNAIAAFEKLTTDLPARDTLLPRSHWYLAQAHAARDEWVLAATSYSRLVESFPDDTLSDNAALEASRAYARLWRKPALDATYGETAVATYTTLFGLYPESPLIPQAKQEFAVLEEKFAQKNYLSGMYYFRRKAWDSGIIYFKDVLAKYPATPTARLAQLRLVDSYKAISYREDAAEACAALRANYPADDESRDACEGIASPAPSTPADSASAPPPATGPPSAPPAIPPGR